VIPYYPIATSMHFPAITFKAKSFRTIGWLTFGLLGTAAIAIALQQRPPATDISSDTIAVTTQDLVVEIPANGVVQPVQKINVSPNREGHVVAVYVEEGEQVTQGQLIARVSNQEAQAQVNQYQAALAKAEADLALKRSGSSPNEIAAAVARVATEEANVAQAQAKLQQAQTDRDRYQALLVQGAVSLKQFDDFLTEEREAQATLRAAQSRLTEQRSNLANLQSGTRPEEIAQAEASVAEAKEQLRYYTIQLAETQIRAPFAGTITRLFIQPGDFVTPTTATSSGDGATSASIAELSNGIEIEAKVPETSISQIRVDQKVEIHSNVNPDHVFQGRVRLIAPRAVTENNVTTFRVKITLQTGLDALKLGTSIRLGFLGRPVRHALVVPLATIVTRPSGETGVLVADENDASQFRPVTIGATVEDQVQILQGLSEGDRVFLSPPDAQAQSGSTDGLL
jgi:HlyD family secretion protein